MTSDASIRAYLAIPDLERRQEKVLRTIERCPGASSCDIARIAHMEPWNVRNRITELLKAGSIRVGGTKRDRLTGRTVRQYEAAEDP